MIHIKPLMGSGIGEIYVLNNHFTSLAGGIEATEPRRNEQALWNVQIMLEIAEKDPEAQFIVLGDLNSFVDSLPIQSLRAASLKHVFDIDRGQTWYSYIYQGTTQTLDHILVSEGLFEILVEAIALHTNADFPLPAPGDPSPRHKSDHDPIIAIFSP
jgi:predicted extracellular nuclease